MKADSDRKFNLHRRAFLWLGVQSCLLSALIATTPTTFASETNVTPSLDAKVGKYLQDHRSDIVIITGTNGGGSGFIFSKGGRQFLASNIHVIAAVRPPSFATLDGTPLRFKPNSRFVAVGHDIFMMELEASSNGIPVVESFEKTVTVNDPIVVFGNSGGGDVATAITGKVVGIGPDRVEIDAEIEHGNSGSPIVHLSSGKVIGVATYVMTEKTISGKTKDRRFGYRLDTVRKWEAVDWARFYHDADQLEKICAVTGELQQAFAEVYETDKRKAKSRVYSYESPVIRNALDNFYNGVNQAQSRQDVSFAVNGLLNTLHTASQYPGAKKPVFTYDYFRREFKSDDSDRSKVMKMFVDSLQK